MGKPRGISGGNLPRRDDAIKTIIYFKVWNTLFQPKRDIFRQNTPFFVKTLNFYTDKIESW